jgi:putative transposase
VVNKGRLRIYVGYVLKHQIVGLENISEGAWDIIFGPVLLGRVDERDAKDGYLTLKVIKNK